MRRTYGFLLFFCVAAVSTRAHAIVTITDVANSSSFALTASSTTAANTAKIYGGMAGQPQTNISLDPESPVDTCANPITSGLVACNNRRIHPNLRLAITFNSSNVTGKPVVLSVGSSTDTPLTLAAGSPTSANQGNAVTVFLTWQSLCASFGADVDGNTCVPSNNATAFTKEFKIGISSDGDETPEDFARFTVIINSGIGQASGGITGTTTTDTCESTAAGIRGLCHFEVGAGDSKVVLKNIVGYGSFPTGSPLQLKSVRLLWSETSFGAIDSTSSFSDLTINSTSEGALVEVTPQRVEGFDNDRTYYFKTAVVDLAGNVGYYTPSGSTGDTYCLHSTTPTGSDCHIATPGEVVGVLANDVNCFIATAAYGSSMAPQVDTFRAFRNKFLLPTKWGRAFVRFYYEYSPYWASKIAESDTLRSASRMLLAPALFFVWLSVNFGLVMASLSALFALAIAITAFKLLARTEPEARGDRG